MSRFSIRERVRWSDVDAAEIIFYGAYIRFFEIAESELFRAAGLSYSYTYEKLDIWLPRVHIECDFHSLARLDDLLEVQVWIEKLGTTSVALGFEVLCVNDDEPTPRKTASARYVLVAVARENFAKVELPEDLRSRLAPFAP